MSEVLFLVGLSNSGKDWVAQNKFANYELLKCNAAFKAVYEEDHQLAPSTCNDKAARDTIHEKGPMTGLTIREGMVRSYHQSITGTGYGHKFAALTLVSVLNKIYDCSTTRMPIVITDLRKPTELKGILNLAEVIKYDVRMIHIKSNKGLLLSSDESLEHNLKLFHALTGKYHEICFNNY